MFAGAVMLIVAAGSSGASSLRYCGNATPLGQATTTRATPDVPCAQARRVLAKTDSNRCFSPHPHLCTVEGFRCRPTNHTAHDGAGFTITRCVRGRAVILGKTGP
jgi:hypothetical protein